MKSTNKNKNKSRCAYQYLLHLHTYEIFKNLKTNIFIFWKANKNQNQKMRLKFETATAYSILFSRDCKWRHSDASKHTSYIVKRTVHFARVFFFIRGRLAAFKIEGNFKCYPRTSSLGIHNSTERCRFVS